MLVSQRVPPLLASVVLVLAAMSRVVSVDNPTANPLNASMTEQISSSGEDMNCMLEWYVLAGASPNETLALADVTRQVELDERQALRYRPLVLSLILGFNFEFTRMLVKCINRSIPCPRGVGSARFPCSPTGECVFNRTNQQPSCRCPPGLFGDRCQNDLNECRDATLNECADASVAVCYNIPGSYVCQCRPGYIGNGRQCADVNECTSESHNCHVNASCSNRAGSFLCNCSEGFEGNGTTCKENPCLASTDQRLCQMVQTLIASNDMLRESLTHRDTHIARQAESMDLLAKVADGYERRLRTITKVFAIERRATRLKLAELATVQRQLSREQERSHSTLEGKVEELQKCRVIGWKSFTKFPSPGFQLPQQWTVVFDKLQNNSVLRITHTSMMSQESFGLTKCFRYSMLVNGSQCRNPAPISLSFSQHSNSGSSVFSTRPHTITGVCNAVLAGPIRLTSSMEQCAGRSVPAGSPGQGNTTTLFVEELSPCE